MTDLQLKVMRILWLRGTATVTQVQEDLRPENDLAVTTVSTLLSRMVKRGDVTMERDGRQFFYRAAVDEIDVKARTMGEVADLLFSGSTAAAILQLLDTTDLDPTEIQELLKKLNAKQAKQQREGEAS